jgi:hypothetical protein
MRGGASAWRGRLIPWALAVLVILPAHAARQTNASPLEITAQVVDYCTFDSSAYDLLSTWCSLNTPMLASPSGDFSSGTTNAGGTANSSGTPNNLSTASGKKQALKLCDSLESAMLENASFNQFHADVSHLSDAPPTYYSTYNICF